MNMADSKWNKRKEKHIEDKTTSQEEILQKWKENFKYLLGNTPEIDDKPTDTLKKYK